MMTTGTRTVDGHGGFDGVATTVSVLSGLLLVPVLLWAQRGRDGWRRLVLLWCLGLWLVWLGFPWLGESL